MVLHGKASDLVHASKTARFSHSVWEAIKCVVLSFRALQKVKLHEAWHLLEVTDARHPNVFERCFGPLGDAKAVHAIKILTS